MQTRHLTVCYNVTLVAPILQTSCFLWAFFPNMKESCLRMSAVTGIFQPSNFYTIKGLYRGFIGANKLGDCLICWYFRLVFLRFV